MDGPFPRRSLSAAAAVLVLLAGCAGSASGPVIHVNLAVPLASAAALGSTCDAAALRATGPIAATIPGSRLQLTDFDQALDAANQVYDPNETSTPIDTGKSITPLGEQMVPATGAVVKPISDDPDFPAACIFSFDVPTTADVKKAYLFSVGSTSFPVPAMLRADLEAAGWVANIGVNPQ